MTPQRHQAEQAATAMAQMTATVLEIARNAGSTAAQARRADELTKAGQQPVIAHATDIQKLAQEVAHSGKVDRQVEHDSEEVGNVLDVIRGIAGQTNLLAPDAAIEAARAAARAMEQGSIQSSETRAKAGVAADTMTRIADSVPAISQANLQIARTAQEQGAVSSDIDRSVSLLNDAALQDMTAHFQVGTENAAHCAVACTARASACGSGPARSPAPDELDYILLSISGERDGTAPGWQAH